MAARRGPLGVLAMRKVREFVITSSTRAARCAAACAATAIATVVGSVGLATPAAAHERWFVDNTPGGDWQFFFSPLPLALTAAVVAATAVWVLIAARLPRPELPPLRRLAGLTPYAPRLLAVTLGISLIALAATGDFLTPSVELDDVAGGPVAGALEVVLGLWLIGGRWLRYASVVVAAMAAVVAFAAGPSPSSRWACSWAWPRSWLSLRLTARGRRRPHPHRRSCGWACSPCARASP